MYNISNENKSEVKQTSIILAFLNQKKDETSPKSKRKKKDENSATKSYIQMIYSKITNTSQYSQYNANQY
jgi:hypothetical protein